MGITLNVSLKGGSFLSPPPFLVAPARRWRQYRYSQPLDRSAFPIERHFFGAAPPFLGVPPVLFQQPPPPQNAIATTTKGNTKKRLSSPSLHIKRSERRQIEDPVCIRVRRLVQVQGLREAPFCKTNLVFLIEPFSAHRCLLCPPPPITPTLFFIPPSLCRVRQAL